LPWPWPAAGAMLPGAHPRSEQAQTIHELHDRLQVDPRRGIGRGVARVGMARDASPARGRGPPLGLSAVLALRLALALAPILPTALSIGLLLGAVSASAGSPRRYQEYDQGAYLPYVNAPGPSADIIASPLLRVSFGGRSYAAVMDTGSTGVVVSADKIPNIASLQSLGPGQLTYSSSGRIMIGRWV